MEPEREQERRTYQLCRLGFAILSFALIVACLSTLLALPRLFHRPAFLPWLHPLGWWKWHDSVVVWGSLVGAYLLWARWSEPSWLRRTGLLVVMSAADAVLWLIEHGQDLGLRTEDYGHFWLRYNFGQALGWAEFALMASLSCEVMVHLGVTQANETGKATRSLAATGSVVWMLWFYKATDWSSWPLEWQRFRTLESELLKLGSTLIWTITLIQVTALTIAATKQCGRVLAEIDHDALENDLLRSASEQGGGGLTGFGPSWHERQPPEQTEP